MNVYFKRMGDADTGEWYATNSAGAYAGRAYREGDGWVAETRGEEALPEVCEDFEGAMNRIVDLTEVPAGAEEAACAT